MKAVLCPVCNGSGTYHYPLSQVTNQICHGCEGKGWVEVGEEEKNPFAVQVDDAGDEWLTPDQVDFLERIYINPTANSSNRCPTCGRDKWEPASTGCPRESHYGTYC